MSNDEHSLISFYSTFPKEITNSESIAVNVIQLSSRTLKVSKLKQKQVHEILRQAITEGRIQDIVEFMTYMSLASNKNRTEILISLQQGSKLE